jgi:hypothetical protein
MVLNATNGMVGRFSVEANGVEASSFFVGASQCDEKLQACNEYLAAQELNGAGVKNTTIRAISILEPAFGGAGTGKTLTFYGWKTDGTVLPASPPRARKIELLGDSISAGYGSRGSAALHAADECPVNDLTSGNLYTYNWKIAEHFSAQLVPIAWSGKGMYKNCCDNGELMPAYWLQTLAGMGCSTPACTGSTDWDHSRYVPDMMIINLGTNDFGHDNGKELTCERERERDREMQQRSQRSRLAHSPGTDQIACAVARICVGEGILGYIHRVCAKRDEDLPEPEAPGVRGAGKWPL